MRTFLTWQMPRSERSERCRRHSNQAFKEPRTALAAVILAVAFSTGAVVGLAIGANGTRFGPATTPAALGDRSYDVIEEGRAVSGALSVAGDRSYDAIEQARAGTGKTIVAGDRSYRGIQDRGDQRSRECASSQDLPGASIPRPSRIRLTVATGPRHARVVRDSGVSMCPTESTRPRPNLYSAAMQLRRVHPRPRRQHAARPAHPRSPRDLGPPDRQPLLLAKLETLNPGGSVKDRIGLPMIEAAERAGSSSPAARSSSRRRGNTGHGLAIAAALKGYRCIFVMADKQSTEKQALLRAYGAEVVLCPTNVAPESPESYYCVAARLARDIPGAFKPDQYWNLENPAAHEATTGPEIWDQTEGRITHFVASVGTGGTISGVGART